VVLNSVARDLWRDIDKSLLKLLTDCTANSMMYLMAIIEIRVKPNATKSFVGGVHGDQLIVSVQAPAVDGKANKAVTEVIAQAFGIKRNAVSIVGGLTSRYKRLSLEGDEELIAARLQELRGDLF
jgi:uncharacterized protein (TIGR00251 family)